MKNMITRSLGGWRRASVYLTSTIIAAAVKYRVSSKSGQTAGTLWLYFSQFLRTRFPYILRKSLLVGWMLVGEAYVQGIMYGEFMEEEKREEVFSLYWNSDQHGMASLEMGVGFSGFLLIHFIVVTSPLQFD